MNNRPIQAIVDTYNTTNLNGVRCRVVDDSTVIKLYTQEVAGAVHKKLASDVLLLKEAGVKNIIISFAGEVKFEGNYKRQVELVRNTVPAITIDYMRYRPGLAAAFELMTLLNCIEVSL